MNQFQSRGDAQQRPVTGAKQSSGLRAEDRAQSLPSRKNRIAHRFVNGIRKRVFGRKYLIEFLIDQGALLFKVLRNRCRNVQIGSEFFSSLSKGSATTFPPAFFIRIWMRPSASGSCFWQTSD